MRFTRALYVHRPCQLAELIEAMTGDTATAAAVRTRGADYWSNLPVDGLSEADQRDIQQEYRTIR